MLNVEVIAMSIGHIDDVMIVEDLSFSIPWSRAAFIEEITNNKFAIYVSAKIDNKIIGYAGMWKVFDEGHITNVAVHPEFRGMGIGSLLVEKLVEISKDRGITSMTLEVRRSNLIAQELYIKHGFKAGGFRKAYYADNNEDAVIMWKYEV